MSIHIRLTKPEDTENLKKWLFSGNAIQWFPMINEKEIDDAARIWVSYAKLEAGITAEWEGIACGMANLYIQPYKKLAHQCLFSIIVDHEYRNKGVGAALITHLKHYAKERFKIEVLHLEVYDGNPAIRLYERMGFKKYGQQERFIKDQGRYVTKICMQQTL